MYRLTVLLAVALLASSPAFAVQTGGAGAANPVVITGAITAEGYSKAPTLEITSGVTKLGSPTYTWPSSLGSANSFLKDSGSGALAWETISGTVPDPTAAGSLLIGSDAAGSWQSASLTGDIAVTSTGVTTIGSNAITQAKMADNSVGTAEIIDGSIGASKIADGIITGGKLASNIAISTSGSISATSIAGAHYGDGSALTGVSATTAETAGSAGYATTAGSATTATSATTAETAGSAGYATTAGSATSATTAETAGSAGYAAAAGSATSATTAETAGSAGYATTAGSATSATTAETAGSATPSGAAGGDLTGTYPNPSIGANKIVASYMATDSVTSGAIAANAVTAIKIADGSITTGKLASDLLVPVSKGGTGTFEVPSGQLLFGNGTSAIQSNNTLTWNNTGKVLIMRADGDGENGSIVVFKADDDGAGENLGGTVVYTSRGTIASPTNTQAGDILGVFAAGGKTDSSYELGAGLIAMASESWSDTQAGSMLLLGSVADGATALDLDKVVRINGGAITAPVLPPSLYVKTDAGSTLTAEAIDLSSGITGTLQVAQGGTSVGSFTQYGVVYPTTSTSLAATGAGAAGTVLKGTGNAPEFGQVVTAEIASGAVTTPKLASNIDINTTGSISAGGSVTIGTTLEAGGRVIYTPSGTETITAGGGVTAAMLAKKVILIAGDGAGTTDISANPQIAAGSNGQMIILIGTNDSNLVKFDNGNGLQLSAATSFTLGIGDILQLVYVDSISKWVEISRTDN